MHASRADSSLHRWDNEGGAPKVRRSSRAKRSASAPQATSSVYYFNIRSDRALIQDTKGCALPDLEAALQEAIALAHTSIAEGNRIGQDRRSWRVEIMDQAQEHVMTLVFAEAYQCGWPRGHQED